MIRRAVCLFDGLALPQVRLLLPARQKDGGKTDGRNSFTCQL